MKKTHSILVSSAFAGLMLGAGSSLTSCTSKTETLEKNDKTGQAQAAVEKHACATLNTCSNKGGCKTGDAGCKGKNTCAKKGGCATVDPHTCATKNACKGQGGCKSGDAGCKGKNTCDKKGGCAVPIKH